MKNKKLKYAKFSRLTAFVIDIMIFNIIFMTISLLILDRSRSLHNLILFFNLFLLLNLIFIFVNAFLFRNFGGSLGKILCDLKIINYDNSYLKFRDYFFREFIAKFFSSVVFNLGYVYLIFNKNSQGFHDLMSETYVIKEGNSKPIISFIVVSLIFTTVLSFFIVKTTNDGIWNKMNNHSGVLVKSLE